MSLDQVRAVADAVLYEGYLLYPYRATSRKNQVRWQFGVLGPPGAADRGVGEESSMATQCLLDGPPERLTVHLRFLQLQTRTVERYDGQGVATPVDVLTVGDLQLMSWDEAVECECVVELSAADLRDGTSREVTVEGGEDVEAITDGETQVGRIVRRREPLRASITVTTADDDAGVERLEVRVDNVHPDRPSDKDAAIRSSLIGAHLVLSSDAARFLSVIDPPESARATAGRCRQHRCWPVLAGSPDEAAPSTSDVVLGSPIILYDFPEVAEQSSGSLFDATEIDEILTLRVMTMTEAEKAEARATDAKAREIIDRCDQLSPGDLQQLHGILRNPYTDQAGPSAAAGPADIRNVDPPTFGDPDVPWWDPTVDEAVQPELDAVVIDGVRVAKGSLVRVHPSRRADAQDMFFDSQVARVAAVLSDVDGDVHVALVLADDPGADLHDWYGRYWYYAPDELEPLPDHSGGEPQPVEHREESRP